MDKRFEWDQAMSREQQSIVIRNDEGHGIAKTLDNINMQEFILGCKQPLSRAYLRNGIKGGAVKADVGSKRKEEKLGAPASIIEDVKLSPRFRWLAFFPK